MRCEWACGESSLKVRQRVQLVYEWLYLFLVVDGRRGIVVDLDRLDEVWRIAARSMG